jgi:hypothetical protein
MRFIILLFLFASSCQSNLVRKSQTYQNKNIQPLHAPTDSNSTTLGLKHSDLNIFDSGNFSPFEVFTILIIIILTLCFVSFFPDFYFFIKRKRS